MKYVYMILQKTKKNPLFSHSGTVKATTKPLIFSEIGMEIC